MNEMNFRNFLLNISSGAIPGGVLGGLVIGWEGFYFGVIIGGLIGSVFKDTELVL